MATFTNRRRHLCGQTWLAPMITMTDMSVIQWLAGWCVVARLETDTRIVVAAAAAGGD